MKSFTDLFIKRPVLAMVVSFVILIAGSKAILPILFPKQLAGLGGLNVRQYPRSDIASISITTVYVGADAELVRGFIIHRLSARSLRLTGLITSSRRASRGSRRLLSG
jgi:multidrug efflux pump